MTTATPDDTPRRDARPLRLSALGRGLVHGSGIVQLMEDLGRAMSGRDDVLMLGGGNPGIVPEVQRTWRRRMQEVLDDGERFDRMLAHYDGPRGNPEFAEAAAAFFRRECGWDVGPQNVAVTNGGQTAAFCLMNLFAGEPDGGGPVRPVVVPISPEYIGYADQSLPPGRIVSTRPGIEPVGERDFRYRIDFDRLDLESGAGCVFLSRPSNPTGNVVANADLHRLAGICARAGVPLIVDNAYGDPFPGAVFVETELPWNNATVHVFSLSKLGLPGTRTGIVLAPEPVVGALSCMNAVLSLASGNVGQALVLPLLQSGELRTMARDVIRPFYERKSHAARASVAEFFPPEVPWRMHVSEGAFFLWLWLEGLPGGSTALYRRLRERGVLVVPGDHFFYGLAEPWDHAHECIRITFSQDDADVRRGIEIIGRELRETYAGRASG